MLLCLSLGGMVGAQSQNQPPNILVFMVDDVLREELGFLNPGGALTPAIDRIANEGIEFTRAYCTGSVCSSARFSLFSGRLPERAINKEFLRDTEIRGGQSFVNQNAKLLSSEWNVAKVLKRAGYMTAFVGKTDGIDKGQDYHKIKPDENPTDPDVQRRMKENQKTRQAFLRECGFDYPLYLHRGNIQAAFSTKRYEVHNMEVMTQSALEFLDIAKQKKDPFFLVVSTSLMHSPSEFSSLVEGDPLASEAGPLPRVPQVQPSRQSVIDRCKEAGLDPEKAAAPLWMDDGLNAILQRLEKLGVADDTLVVFYNDNGHDDFGKASIYEGGFNTILTARWGKGIKKPGRQSQRLVSSMDLAPTFFELAGISAPAEMHLDGASLVPILSDQVKTWRDHLYLSFGYARAIVANQYKYIAVRFPNGFDLAAFEKTNYEQGQKWGEATGKDKTLRYNSKQQEALEKVNGRYGQLGASPAFFATAQLNHFITHPAYFDADQLYDLNADSEEHDNLADSPEYSGVMNKMQSLLKEALADKPGHFGAFKSN